MKPSRAERREKAALRRRSNKPPRQRRSDWLSRHEAEREEADEAMAQRLVEDHRHG